MPPSNNSAQVRLNKYIADCGVASRRKADQLIEEGQIQVNGKTVFELGVKVEPAVDRITLKGKPIKPQTQMVYVIFYKPENVLTTMSDPEGRPTVADFMEKLPVRVFPVGRLDWDTEGMLLLTNDGEFSQKVMHPKEEIPKTYLAKLDGRPSATHFEKLKSGVPIPGGRGRAVFVDHIRMADSERDWVKIIIAEGKNRQIRHMFAKIGFDVLKLKRVAIGQLTMGKLRKGEYAFLDEGTLSRVFKKHKGAEGPTPMTAAGRRVIGGRVEAGNEDHKHPMRRNRPVKKKKFKTKRDIRAEE